jgi:hypothetical protein
MDRTTDGQNNRWPDQQIERPVDGQTSRWTDQQMVRRTDGHTNRWTDKQIGKLTDGQIQKEKNYRQDMSNYVNKLLNKPRCLMLMELFLSFFRQTLSFFN